MELLEQVESYLARTRVPPSTFGRLALGDPRLVDDLRAGRKLRRKTQERVRYYLTKAASHSGPLTDCQISRVGRSIHQARSNYKSAIRQPG